jgi:hypothetical protein
MRYIDEWNRWSGEGARNILASAPAAAAKAAGDQGQQVIAAVWPPEQVELRD